MPDTALIDEVREIRHRIAEECENISITGMGKIDCNGLSCIKEKEN